MPKQNVILVAGFNYHAWRVIRKDRPDRPDYGTNFAVFCERRAQLLKQKLPHATFWLFDFGAGVLRVSEEDSKGRRQGRGGILPGLTWVQHKQFTKLTQADYKGHGLKRPSPQGAMSITDVYDYIKRLGRSDKDVGPAGTLIELSFFSHGFNEGPILVNSSEPEEIRSKNERDKWDLDPRLKDFIMSKEDFAAFRNAFAPGGLVWAFGCNRRSDYTALFEKLEKATPKYNQTPRGKIDDNQMIVFHATKDNEDFYLDHKNKTLFTAGRKPHTFESTMKKIKDYYNLGLKETYMSNIAAVARVLVYGALPGTEAALQGKDGLMEVATDQSLKKSDDAETRRYKLTTGVLNRKLIEFYITYMNSTIDPEGRNYGMYLPGNTIVTPFGSAVVG
jgi:hypothetical protein